MTTSTGRFDARGGRRPCGRTNGRDVMEIGSIRSRRRCSGGDIWNTQRLCSFSSYISRLGMLQSSGLVGNLCKERYNPHEAHIMDPLPELL
ncbi:hypothetical protein L1987_49295 [Smallanthus sonchifolius]|uniref:Uncharacterized protein n=1 Tax=Smallanthus sonchifolius TaxID=185202 RepID=A0ACB9FU50_9ASTR|nr:hypothetical protein L1987_49295 [Smallanthus sonchifolius]